jgi:uncharacterized lipoprotein YmbA
MMLRKNIGAIAWLLGLALLFLNGCKGVTPPVQFYTLTVPEAQAEAAFAAEAKDAIAVGVGPLELPKMLDRPQIVTRGTGNRLQMAEFHRWGGSLPEDILRVLTENLSGLLQSNRVMAHPWADFFQPDYRVYLVFHRFDGRPGESLVLNATWTLTDARGREAFAVRRSVIREPLASADYESLVAASSRTLEILSRQIAQEISHIRAK